MGQQKYTLTFDNSSGADANRWASELKELLLKNTSDVVVEQQRDNPYSQDFGTTLVLLIGTPAVVVLAKTLGNWLLRHREVSITIKTPSGKLVGKNLTSKDALKLTELFLAQKKEE